MLKGTIRPILKNIGFSDYSTTTWAWVALSDQNSKNIYDSNYQDEGDEVVKELMTIQWKKWAYKDSAQTYYCQKKCDGSEKQEQMKVITPCYQSLQDKRFFARAITYKHNAEDHQIKYGVDWTTFNTLCGLGVKQLAKKVYKQQEQIQEQQQTIDQLKQDNLSMRCRIAAIEKQLGIN